MSKHHKMYNLFNRVMNLFDVCIDFALIAKYHKLAIVIQT